MKPPRLLFSLTLAAVLAAPGAQAADLLIRFDAVKSEPLEVERTGPLTGPGVAPIKAGFAVILLTPDGTLPAADLAKVHNAAQILTNALVTSARLKYGTDLPVTHEIIVCDSREAPAHRTRLRQAGFTFINRSSVPTETTTVGFEGFGLKEFPPDAVLGTATVTVTLQARPRISSSGGIRLNLTPRAGIPRATATAPGASAEAVQAALVQFRADSAEQAAVMLLAVNQRAWMLTARDREMIVNGVHPLRKAVPFPIFEQTARLKLSIEAHLELTGEIATDPSWDFSL